MMSEHRFAFERWRALAGVAITLLVLPFAVACGDGASGAGSTPTSLPSATSTATPLATATATASPPLLITPSVTETAFDPLVPNPEIRPPAARLAADAGSQRAEIGTFCWTEHDQGLCLDFVGIPVPPEALGVSRGENLTITVPGIQHISNVDLKVYNHAAAEPAGDQRMIHYPLPEPVAERFSVDGRSITMAANLPPGEYVVSVFMSFPADTSATPTPSAMAGSVRGDAQYGFHIIVK